MIGCSVASADLGVKHQFPRQFPTSSPYHSFTTTMKNQLTIGPKSVRNVSSTLGLLGTRSERPVLLDYPRWIAVSEKRCSKEDQLRYKSRPFLICFVIIDTGGAAYDPNTLYKFVAVGQEQFLSSSLSIHSFLSQSTGW